MIVLVYFAFYIGALTILGLNRIVFGYKLVMVWVLGLETEY